MPDMTRSRAGLIPCLALALGAGGAAAETALDGVLFTTPRDCGPGTDAACDMVSFQIYGEAALTIYDGMTSEVSKTRDLCLGWYSKTDAESGLSCFVSDDRSEALCTFGYDFARRQMRVWDGSC